MSFVSQITVVILTFNEEANLARTLAALGWATSIIVVDSGSTDGTLEILGRDPRITILRREFDTFAGQCNFALERVRTEWVLSIDADYEISEQLGREICALEDNPDIAGFRARFEYRIFGRPLRGSLYPPRCVLYRRGQARYIDRGHGHRVEIDGAIGTLHHPIYHDDRKPLSRWLSSQVRYARDEADLILSADRGRLGLTDRLRLLTFPAPLLVLPYVLLVKGCILDGVAGLFYAMQRFTFETILMLELLERRLRRSAPPPGN